MNAAKSWLDDVTAVLGRKLLYACLLAIVVGLLAFVIFARGPESGTVWGTLLASWLFFVGAAAGVVAFRAVLHLTRAEWGASLATLGTATLSFAPVAGILLLVALVGVQAWAPWTTHSFPSTAFWLNVRFFVARELMVTVGLFMLARAYLARRSGPREPAGMAVAYLLAYVGVLSIWSWDFVLGVDPAWVSTLIGPHVFMGALLSGVSLSVFLALINGRIDSEERHLAGKLIFGLSVFWAYLLWSQYLPIWYGNLPEEIGFVIRRSEPGWRVVSLAVIALTFAVPFIGIFTEKAKRNPRTLGMVAITLLFGLWLERYMLIVPSFEGAHAVGVPQILVALGILAAFVIAVAGAVERKLEEAGALSRPGTHHDSPTSASSPATH